MELGAQSGLVSIRARARRLNDYEARLRHPGVLSGWGLHTLGLSVDDAPRSVKP